MGENVGPFRDHPQDARARKLAGEVRQRRLWRRLCALVAVCVVVGLITIVLWLATLSGSSSSVPSSSPRTTTACQSE